MQLIRRGGIKGGPKVGTHEEADRKLGALRKRQEAEDDSRRAGGTAGHPPAAGPKAKAAPRASGPKAG
eukprot:9385325-Pyramimonas_sp.AAC.1